MWHHTASQTTPDRDASYMCNGSPDRPIANLLVARDGVVWILAAGATNTNGKGGPWNWSRGTVPRDSMNAYAVGMELANNGTGGTYPQAQIDAAFAASTTLCRRLGLDPADICQHHNYAPLRKVDPAKADAVHGPWRPRSTNTAGSWDLDSLIAEHRRRTHVEDDDMPTAREVADAVWAEPCVQRSTARPIRSGCSSTPPTSWPTTPRKESADLEARIAALEAETADTGERRDGHRRLVGRGRRAHRRPRLEHVNRWSWPGAAVLVLAVCLGGGWATAIVMSASLEDAAGHRHDQGSAVVGRRDPRRGDHRLHRRDDRPTATP